MLLTQTQGSEHQKVNTEAKKRRSPQVKTKEYPFHKPSAKPNPFMQTHSPQHNPNYNPSSWKFTPAVLNRRSEVNIEELDKTNDCKSI